MFYTWVRFLLATILLITLQVWVFNSISIFRIATPYVYPVLLLLLPIESSRIQTTLWAFGIGMVIDALALTPGLHASALTLVGFLRYYFIKPMLEEGRYQPQMPAVFGQLGWFSLALLVEVLLVHHLALFFLDAGQFADKLFLLKRMGLSFCYSLALSLMILLSYSIRLKPRPTSHDK